MLFRTLLCVARFVDVAGQDLEEIDLNTVQIARKICEAAPSDPIFRSGTRFMSTGPVPQPLVPGGRNLVLSHINREAYADALINFRLHEYDDCIDAIRRGLGCLVPVRLLVLFTWREVEEMVTGTVTIDVDALQKSTVYENENPDQPHFGYVG